MTIDDLISLRKGMGLTQSDLAQLLGMSTRALQQIENGRSELREVHILAVERIALSQAVKTANIQIAPITVRREALELSNLIKG
jgi:transcriptional regulator with XRE-family HTH domain